MAGVGKRFTQGMKGNRNPKGFGFRSYLNCLVVFPTFFNLSMNLAMRSSWSEPQSAPGLVFADCIKLLHLWLQRV